MKYPPYPKYKPSGVEWLGGVPEHWEVKRLKGTATYCVSNVNKVADDDEIPVKLCNYTDVYYNDYITPDMGLMKTTATQQEINRFGLNEGDVLITKDSEDWRDIAVPSLVVESAPDLVCGYHLAIVRSRESYLSGKFLLRLFQSCAINQQFQTAATGVTRYGLPKSSIGEAWLLLPPIYEQTAIADFLDRETGKIDTLVAKNRTLIERLKEKRSALISRTVTRGLPPDEACKAGLDPHPKLKPSGVEWLGEVPEGWEIKCLKHVAKSLIGVTYSPDDITTEDKGTLVLRASNIQGGALSFRDNVYIDKSLRPDDYVRSGDILICARNGSAHLVGKCARIDQSNAGHTFGAFMSIVRSSVGRYLFHFFNSDVFKAQTGLFKTSTINQLTTSTLNNLQIALPTSPEQTAIADYLDSETAKIDKLIAKIETAIERLREYRTALISAAVTGKIDLRDN